MDRLEFRIGKGSTTGAVPGALSTAGAVMGTRRPVLLIAICGLNRMDGRGDPLRDLAASRG